MAHENQYSMTVERDVTIGVKGKQEIVGYAELTVYKDESCRLRMTKEICQQAGEKPSVEMSGHNLSELQRKLLSLAEVVGKAREGFEQLNKPRV